MPDGGTSAGSSEPPGRGSAATGSATVPAANRLSPASAAEVPFDPAPRLYGTPNTPSEVDAPLPTRSPRQRQQPVYSDLLSPAPAPSADSQPRGAAGTSAPEYAGPAGQPSSPGAPADDYATSVAASLPGGRPTSPPPQPSGHAPPHGHPPAGSPAGATAVGPAAPPAHPQPTPSTPPEQAGRTGPPVGVIVGAVLAGAALLVMIALSIPLLLQYLGSDPEPPYGVGDCVVQDGQQARTVDCGEAGAYEIVLEVDDIAECPDPGAPAITVSDPSAVYCLSPATPADSVGSGESGDDGEDGTDDDSG